THWVSPGSRSRRSSSTTVQPAQGQTRKRSSAPHSATLTSRWAAPRKSIRFRSSEGNSNRPALRILLTNDDGWDAPGLAAKELETAVNSPWLHSLAYWGR